MTMVEVDAYKEHAVKMELARLKVANESMDIVIDDAIHEKGPNERLLEEGMYIGMYIRPISIHT